MLSNAVIIQRYAGQAERVFLPARPGVDFGVTDVTDITTVQVISALAGGGSISEGPAVVVRYGSTVDVYIAAKFNSAEAKTKMSRFKIVITAGGVPKAYIMDSAYKDANWCCTHELINQGFETKTAWFTTAYGHTYSFGVLSLICSFNVAAPTSTPTRLPTRFPTPIPTTALPTVQPSGVPTNLPSGDPTGAPTGRPSSGPTAGPSCIPSGAPTGGPSSGPTAGPSCIPSGAPTSFPTNQHSHGAVVDTFRPAHYYPYQHAEPVSLSPEQ